MIKKISALALGAAVLVGGAAQAAEETKTADAITSAFSFLDSATWHDGAGHVQAGEMIEFDPANPQDWAKVIDPKQHSKVHMTLTNPAHYAKYMTPGYYAKFMDPETWIAYMNPNTYTGIIEVATESETIGYWLQPGAYLHAAQPDGYMQALTFDNYVKLGEDVAEGYKLDSSAALEIINPLTWIEKFASASGVDTAVATLLPEEKPAQ